MPELSRGRPNTVSESVLVIGLDGVTFDWLDRLFEQGRCRGLATLVREGIRGELESTFPPITAVAWTSLATGKNPGKHGIFEFILSRGVGRKPMVANAALRDGEALWEMLSRAGRRVIVTNYPCTYPPRELNGLMIADFMTPRGRRDFTFPRELLKEIEHRHGPYRLHLTQTYAPDNVERVVDELLDELRYKSDVNCGLMEQYPWDVFITHLWGPDRIQHELWHLTDPTHPRYNERESLAYRHRVYGYWEELDRQVSRMIATAGESTSVWVVSDHGFGPAHKYCSFNLWLLDQGLLRLRTSFATKLKRWMFDQGMTPEFAYRASRSRVFTAVRPGRGFTTRPQAVGLLSRIFLSFNDVDWSQTKAYSDGNYGQIFINLKGREPQGIVEPDEEYQRVRAEIMDRLREIVDPDTNEELIGPIWTREELYSGAHLEQAPDICFLPRDMRYLAQGNTDFNSNRFITKAFTNSGSHRMNGIVIARGHHLRSDVRVPQARIYDVMPTILHQMGIEIPDDVDGRVLEEIFDPAYLHDHPPRFRSPGAAAPRADEFEFSPEEQAEVEARLKKLGYLG